MSVHEYHPGLEGYNEEHIWHDGCAECEARGERLAVWTLDAENSRKMGERADAWGRGERVEMSSCEAKLIETIAWVRRYT